MEPMKVIRKTYRNKITLGQDNNTLVWLFAINGVMFIMVMLIKVIYQLSIDSNIAAEQAFRQEFLQWLTLSGKPMEVLTRPWTVLTYMFVHENFWDLLTTILWLWGFGFILQSLSGNNRLIPLYLYGGAIAGIVYSIGNFIFPTLAHPAMYMGGSAAVLCMAVAATSLAPGYRIFPRLNGGIPLWLLTGIFCVIDLLNISAFGPMLLVAHIVAGLTGFLFIHALKNGKDWGSWMNRFAIWFDNLFKPQAKPISQKLFYKATRKPYVKIKNDSTQSLDAILDKINQSGLGSLTEEERDFLDRISHEDK